MEKKCEAYVETDPTHPLGVYGQSKCAGEKAIQEVGGLIYILRTSWVYSNIGQNFYLTMKRLSQERDDLKWWQTNWACRPQTNLLPNK